MFALFFAMRVAQQREKELAEAQEQAREELEEIGLHQDDLKRNRSWAVKKLQHYPDKIARLQDIVEEALLLETA